MEFVQTHYPFSGVSSIKTSNISKDNSKFLYLSIIIFLIGGGIYTYYMLPSKMKPDESKI